MTPKQIYHKYKDIPLIAAIKPAVKGIMDIYQLSASQYRLKKTALKSKHDYPVRVGFLAQDPNIWSKNKPIYEALLLRPEFEVFLFCVPDPYDEDTASTYNWFANSGYKCIDTRIGSGPWSCNDDYGEWLDISEYNLDYIFYGQPYDNYLPTLYHSSVVSSYAKICITMYGIPATQALTRDVYVKGFFCNVYCTFAHVPDEAEYLITLFPKQFRSDLMHVYCLGSTALESFHQTNSTSSSWNFSKNSVRAVWTPRWALYEAEGGGSNFFRYKDVLFELAETEKIDFLFRPHPLTFSNFIREGFMTQNDVDDFKGKCTGNISLDKNKDYILTFINSSFLITDYSSLIIEYFITGKPIIYCETENPPRNLMNFLEDILSVNYTVHNEDELKSTIRMLAAGNDYMAEERLKLRSKLFGDEWWNASARIAEKILEDFTK